MFPETRNVGISYCRLLLHDTMLHDDSHRTGTADTPVCECGLERETAEHFLSSYCVVRDFMKHVISCQIL